MHVALGRPRLSGSHLAVRTVDLRITRSTQRDVRLVRCAFVVSFALFRPQVAPFAGVGLPNRLPDGG